LKRPSAINLAKGGSISKKGGRKDRQKKQVWRGGKGKKKISSHNEKKKRVTGHGGKVPPGGGGSREKRRGEAPSLQKKGGGETQSPSAREPALFSARRGRDRRYLSGGGQGKKEGRKTLRLEGVFGGSGGRHCGTKRTTRGEGGASIIFRKLTRGQKIPRQCQKEAVFAAATRN